MRNFFDKFDRSPIWIRLGVLLLLIVLLIVGLFFMKPNYQTSQTSSEAISHSQSSSSKTSASTKQVVSSSEKAKTIDAQATADAEALVKNLETAQTDENLAVAQAAVDKLKDATAKEKLQDRIQAVKETILATQAGVNNQVQIPQQQQPIYQTPTPAEAPVQNQQTPATNTTTQ